MTDIRHHLTDALLLGYSAGNLPEAFSLVVASHISVCDDCRARLGAFDAVGGTIMANTDAEPMGAGRMEAALAAARAAAPEQAEPAAPVASIFPAPLRGYIGANPADVKWRRIGGGVSQAVIRASDNATVRLLRIPAGSAVPDHGHHGTELTMVLQGAFRDAHDRFAAGDVEVANEDTQHQPIAEDGCDCICLAATDAPLRFKGIIPRIAQRVMRL